MAPSQQQLLYCPRPTRVHAILYTGVCIRVIENFK